MCHHAAHKQTHNNMIHGLSKQLVFSGDCTCREKMGKNEWGGGGD